MLVILILLLVIWGSVSIFLLAINVCARTATKILRPVVKGPFGTIARNIGNARAGGKSPIWDNSTSYWKCPGLSTMPGSRHA